MSDLWVRKARPRNEQMDDWEEVEPERATEADVEEWLDVRNQILVGNCAEVMGELPPLSVDLTVTSPPYDDIRQYGGYEFNHLDVARGLYRVTKQGGVVVWVVSDATKNGSETGTSFRQALTFIGEGFRLHDTMIYEKDNPPPVGGNNRYYQTWEYMFVFSKGKPKTFNPLMRPQRNKWNDKRTSRTRAISRQVDGEFQEKKVVPIKSEVKRGNIWSYVVGGGISASDKVAFEHPAIFPETLAYDHILSWSDPGDLVLDPMAGSGTVPKVAKALGRDYLAIDTNPEYVDLIKRRVEEPFAYRESVK